jgi:4-alpha-glucanotransferase
MATNRIQTDLVNTWGASNPEAWGIALGYENYAGDWFDAPASTIADVLNAMGAEGRPGPPGCGEDGPVRFVRPGQTLRLHDGPWQLRTEDGGTQRVHGSLPPDLPLGYHLLRREADGRPVLLVVSPGRCHLPPELRAWGWAVQLYAVRSQTSWGIGDLADLRRLARWSKGQGAEMMLLNPLHAVIPGMPQQPSPYFPSSRCFRNPIYLRIEDVPGAADHEVDLTTLAAEGRALNQERRIDRDKVWKAKLAALKQVWDRFRATGGDREFDRYCDQQGDALLTFATYCALAEHHRSPWTQWPTDVRRPDTPAVASFARRHRDRVQFHQWLQWLTEQQLATAGAEIDLMQDLAIGVDPAGADAWQWQDCFALDVRVGAPPDELNTKGQDWGLPPFHPWRLRLVGYEPYIRTLRAGLRAAGGLRVDHVMGLFRLFWIPSGVGPAEGTYVRYPWKEMLDILALESERAKAYVVGEDLGTVEDSVREELAARRVLSYRLLWFEQDPPARFPVQALAAVTTHDLPTITGLWSGADLEEQRALNLDPNEESIAEIRSKLIKWTGLTGNETPGEVVERTYQLLAEAPSQLVTAALEDALAVTERMNMPQTLDERPNWSLALPAPLEEIETNSCAATIGRALNRPEDARAVVRQERSEPVAHKPGPTQRSRHPRPVKDV